VSVAAGENRNVFAGIQDFRCAPDFGFRRRSSAASKHIGSVMQNVSRRTVSIDLQLLHVDRHRQVRYASIGKCCPASQIRNILDVVRTHNACVVCRHIDEKLVQLDVLLAVSVDEVVVLKPRDRQDWLSIQFRVIKTVQQMNAARAGSGEAHPELSSVFRVGARHEYGSFFVANLNEPDLIGALSKRLIIPLIPSPGNPNTTSTPQS
jgi:hypothetical protein